MWRRDSESVRSRGPAGSGSIIRCTTGGDQCRCDEMDNIATRRSLRRFSRLSLSLAGAAQDVGQAVVPLVAAALAELHQVIG